MLFWVVVFVMLVLALAILILPILRTPDDSGPDRKQVNVELYRNELARLERERDEGQIDQATFDATKREIDLNLLTDTAATDTGASARTGRLPAIIVAVAVPVLTLALYLGLGRADLATGTAQEERPPELQAIEQMMTRLENRLANDPDDSEGWVMLGRSYTALRRFDDAEKAYAKAYTLIGDDPDFLADYAEIMAMNAGNRLQGPPRRLLEVALDKNRSHIKSLWLSGHAELQAGNNKKAVSYWRRLLKVLPADDEAVATVQQYIAQVEGRAMPPAQAAGAGRLTVKVDLASSQQASVGPDDTVFIFARAASGPRMPLAIVRKQVRDLPLTVTLDDTMAMTPQMTLSKFEQVIVGARISRSGNALAQSGDIQGLSEPVSSSQKQPVAITIDSVIP